LALNKSKRVLVNLSNEKFVILKRYFFITLI